MSANFGIPYTKVTCFADVDKSDIIGAILPVISEDKLDISKEQASLKIKHLIKVAGECSKDD